MASVFYRYDGPDINPAMIRTIVRIYEENDHGVAPAKDDILKIVRKDYAENLWGWVDKKVLDSIETALEIDFIQELKDSNTTRYHALEI